MKVQENITPAEQYVIDYVRKLRTDKGLIQLDIANIIGVGRSFISQAESTNEVAKYNIRHINALADYFGISPREFLPEKAFPVDAPPADRVVKKAPVKKTVVKKVPVKKAPGKKAAVKKTAVKQPARKK